MSLLNTINGNFTVIKEVSIDSNLSIVLARNASSTCFVTWVATDYDGYGQFQFNHGHYIYNYDETLIDFWLRVQNYVDFEIRHLEERLNRF